MSLCTTAVITPFMRMANRAQMKEKLIQDVLKPQIVRIKRESAGAERHSRISKLYSRYSYNPIYAIRSSLGVLIQVPFLMGAYYMLHDFSDLSGQSFLFVSDLSRPDFCLFGLNLLPLLMTFINMVSACVTPDFRLRDIVQAWVIALLFLWILYSAPSALLIFWTCNNILSLLANLKAHAASEREKPLGGILTEVKKSIPKLMLTQRFVRMMSLGFFLLALQSVVAFFMNGQDKREALISHTLSLVALIISIVVYLCKKRGITRLRIVMLSVICSPTLFLWFKWFAAYLEAGFSLRSLIYDPRVALANIAQMMLFGKIYAIQMASAIVVLFFSREKQEKCGAQSFRSKGLGYGMLLSITAIAATSQAVGNAEYLAVSTAWIYYGLFLLMASALCYAAEFIAGDSISRDDTAIVVSIFMFVFLNNPTVQSYFKIYGTTTMVFSLVFIPVIICVSTIKKANKPIVMILAVSSLLSIFLSGTSAGGLDLIDNRNSYADRDSVSVAIKEEDRASVFFLVYDATPDIETLSLLGIDAEPLETLLKDNDFKIYDKTYSIQGNSLESMSRTYDISDAARISTSRKWEICAGNSASFRTFASNGYGTASIQSGYMTGGNLFADEMWPPVDRSVRDKDAVFTLIKGVLMGEFRFDLVGLSEYGEDSYHEFLRSTMAVKSGPWFTAMHGDLPGHSQNSGRLLPNETELFAERLDEALTYMREDIRTILDNNPSAVIVVLGDHGPYLTGDGDRLVDYLPEDISELMIRDRFGTLVAIRWPNPERAERYDDDLITNQDIFPVIFAYLSDSPEPLKMMIGEKKVTYKNHVFIDNGTFIPYAP
jgi:hypothetical protein